MHTLLTGFPLPHGAHAVKVEQETFVDESPHLPLEDRSFVFVLAQVTAVANLRSNLYPSSRNGPSGMASPSWAWL
jgi:hypothetical protein